MIWLRAVTIGLALTLGACGGGGGGDSDEGAGAPSVTLDAVPDTVASGTSASLTWDSANATECTASGGWTGPRTLSGSESSGALSASTSFTLTCTGPGGTMARTVNVIVPASGSVFPLHTEAGKRYLLDAQGQPFLVHGDTPWLLITMPTNAEVDQYLEDRRLKGFNTVLVELIEHKFSTNPPYNVYGNAPFLTPGDFSTPNEAYFSHAEYVIAKAREKGMLVMLTPAYLGFGGGDEGWYPEMVQNGTTKLRNYGHYVATRFQAYDNILWVEGGDYNPANPSLMRAVVDGIREVETTRLHTFHGSRGTAALEWLGPGETWLGLNNIYTTIDTVVAEAQGEYNRSTMPFFLIEDAYEDETANGTQTRQQAWQAVLSGATGQLMGQKEIWRFEIQPGFTPWTARLNTEGASTLGHLRTLLESYAWWTLEPDFANTVLTGGAGSGAGRAPAARSADHSFAFVYAPNVRDLTVNLGALTGSQIQARWYDPTTGAYTTIAGSPFAATGSRVFRPTGNNALGKPDWVLVLDVIS